MRPGPAGRVWRWLTLIACGWTAIGAGLAFAQAAAQSPVQSSVQSPVQSTAPAAEHSTLRPRDLMAVADENHFWIAHVTKIAPDRFTTITQTSIVYRSQWTGGTEWTGLQPVADRVVSVAASGGNLLIVLSNGQWEIADDSGARTGPTGSQWDEMLAVASDASTTWAVVRWQPPSTQESATTQETSTTQASTTNPTTMAATEPAEIHAASEGPRLVVSSYNGGKWSDARPLPVGVADDAARMSLQVVDGLPVLAWVTADGKLCVTSATAQRDWTKPIVIDFHGSLMDFKLLTIRGKLALWLDTNSAATTQASLEDGGEVLAGTDFSKRLSLKMPTTMPSNIGARTLVSAFGNLRWIGYAGDQMAEQDFSEDSFPESLSPARTSVASIPKPMVILLMPWISGYSALIALSILLAVWRRTSVAEEPQVQQAEEEKPRLAPLGVRLMAGLVDLAPIIAIFVVTYPVNGANPTINIDRDSLQRLVSLAVATYVLHTLLAEAICSQSIGKMVFGLRVVNTDGKDTKLLSIVIRNLLRVVDVTLGLPLLIVLITPLRQRVGDIVGGTVVIERDGEDEEEEADGENES